MGHRSNYSASVVIILSFLISFYIIHLLDQHFTLVRSNYTKNNPVFIYERLSGQNLIDIRENNPVNSKDSNIYRHQKCSLEPEYRFDCGRDRVLGQSQCEDRGCCYDPLSNSAGPPWCFYPTFYPGYKMGPLTPTERGRVAVLTRSKPSYLPRDISTLRLEIEERTAGVLHLTVSI